MKVCGVIPARFGSTRFPGKPLKLIKERPLLSWVIQGVKASKKLDEIIVATDHDEIAALAEACGVKAVMTNSDLPSGSDRAWAAVESLDFDVVVNIQGDEPLVTGDVIDQLIKPFEENRNLDMATLGKEMTLESLKSPNTAKIVLNKKSEALYFSRHSIPHTRIEANDENMGCLQHIGMYAFNKNFLGRFCAEPPAEIERLEGLEQLRALYLGAKIKVVKVIHESWGVDVPDDIAKVEKLLEERYGNH